PAWRPRLHSLRAAPFGPAGLDLREDALAELVAWSGESEGCVRVEALEAAGPPRAADAVVERRAAVVPSLAAGELSAQTALLLVAGGEARGERRLGAHRLAPALDASCSLEPRNGSDEVAAGEVVGRRERL